MSKKNHFQYFQYRQQKCQKKCPGENGFPPEPPATARTPAPFSMTKNVQKMFLKCFFILPDIFLTFFWNYFWSAGHFFDIFLAGLKILEMTFFRHFFGIFELIQPNRLGPTQIKKLLFYKVLQIRCK